MGGAGVFPTSAAIVEKHYFSPTLSLELTFWPLLFVVVVVSVILNMLIMLMKHRSSGRVWVANAVVGGLHVERVGGVVKLAAESVWTFACLESGRRCSRCYRVDIVLSSRFLTFSDFPIFRFSVEENLP